MLRRCYIPGHWQSEAKANYLRLKISNHIIEVDQFQKPVWTGGISRGGRKEQGEELTDPETIEKNRRDAAHRAKKRIADLARCNFDVRYAKFVTLTFRDGTVENVKDPKDCIKALLLFLKRMRRRYGKFKYLWAMEFQDGNGRGAVHYHVLLDIQPKIPYGVLNECWTWGGTDIKAIRRVDDIGRYIVKYVSKTIGDPRRGTSNLWGTSMGMNDPIVLYGEEADRWLEAHGVEYIKKEHLVDRRMWSTEYQGEVLHEEYNLQRDNSKAWVAN